MSLILDWSEYSRGEREFPFSVIPGNTSLKFPFPWHFVISLPVPGKRKFWPGIRTGNIIILCSFEHFLMCSLYINIIFTLVKEVSVLACK